MRFGLALLVSITAWSSACLHADEKAEETAALARVKALEGQIERKNEAGAARAEAYFEHALAIAREQQTKSLELRAAVCTARLWRHQGKRNEARELLTLVYGWFTEGFETRNLTMSCPSDLRQLFC